MATPVTDPAILALLNADEGKKPVPVTDPAILAQLEGKSEDKPKEEKGILQTIREAIHSPTRILENSALLGLGDRARAGMDALIGNGGYGANLKNEQAQTDQFNEAHPIAAPVIGGIGGAIAPVGTLGAIAKGSGLGMKTLAGAGAGAGFGGLQGGLSSRDWTDIPQTAKDIAVGAGVGGILGGSLPLAGKAIGSGYNALADALTKPEGISRGASRHLIEAMNADGPRAVQGQISRLGPDAMLADTGPAMLGKAQGTSLNSDEGRSVLANALSSRNEGTNARIQSDVERTLGPAEDPQTVTNAIKAQRAAVDNVNYSQALDHAPPVDVDPIVTQINARILQTPVGSMEHRALTNARDMLQTRVGPVTDANVLHRVKGELDNVIEYDAPGLGVPAGALQRQQGALKQIRGALNSELETQVPGYAEANAASRALAQRAEAVQTGTQYLGSGKTTPSPDRFAAEFDPLSQGEKIAFAKGSRGNIERVLGTKANDLQALRTELQGEGGWNTAKLATVHGQDAADELAASVDRNLKFRDTYNKVVENSQTAQRQAAARGMKPEPSSETPLLNPNMSLTGLAATGAKKAANALLNTMRPDPTKSFGEVARILSAQGGQRDQHLAALIDALSRRQGNQAMASKVGDRAALAAALLGNGYVQSRPSQIQSQ